MTERTIPNLTFGELTGRRPLDRDPIGQAVVRAFVDHHPDWTDEQICARINREYETPVITVEEVAQWRPGASR